MPAFIETLESRTLFSIDTSSVGLYTPSGVPTHLTKQAAFFVIHGLTADQNDFDTQNIAKAVQLAVPSYQVIIVGWGALASAAANPTNPISIANAKAAGDAVTRMIKAAKLPASRVNMIGYSMGGQVEDRIARNLGSVNRIVAVDPAAPGIAFDSRGYLIHPMPDFKGHSNYSLAFSAMDGYAYFKAALTADDTVLLTGLSADALQRHTQTVSVFSTMMQRNAGLIPLGNDHISNLFSIQHILDGTLPAWTKDTYGRGFEASLGCTMIPGTGPDPFQADFEPTLLTYVNRRRHTLHVRAV